MPVIIITGTGTDAGKTVVTAGIAACAKEDGKRVAVLKPAQTGVSIGEAGDIDEIARLVDGVTTAELARYPDPLAPRTAARCSGQAPLAMDVVVEKVKTLDATHDLVLVEGAGGLLVQFDEAGNTIASLAQRLQAIIDVHVLMVTSAGLGTLNMTALTAESLRHRQLRLMGLVIGRWPADPDLASRCNLDDLPDVANAPLLGVVPDNFDLDPRGFGNRISHFLAPQLHGQWNGVVECCP